MIEPDLDPKPLVSPSPPPQADPTPLPPASLKSASTLHLLTVLLKDEAKAIQLLDHLNLQTPADLWKLEDRRTQELIRQLGFTPTQAAKLLAALELGKRSQQLSRPLGSILQTANQAAHLFQQQLTVQNKEHIMVLWLDHQHRYLGGEVHSIGTITETLVDPAALFQGAIRINAAHIIIGHNHPSGSTSPSPEDLHLTQRILAVGDLLGITVLDHLILGRQNYQSLRETTNQWHT